ncbi:MAG: cytochrome P450 [Acidimicrobiaceae bacterium]|nr:cytochrome P450 [Acidimicrobiaceae bacterium]MYA74908.1 cytochrome P450 [Acidimicrobiaceae bacterium]MYG56070.1 cytochrome P450 [Acidimicrobiaceae bacterium]MYK00064.1 cytochrome P450 [Acidimicrobiaceae bacterium]
MGTAARTPVDLADVDLYSQGIPHKVFAAVRATPGLCWNQIAGSDQAAAAPATPGVGTAQASAAPATPGNNTAPGDSNGFWAVTRHADVVEVSRDTTTYSSAVGHIQIYDIDEDALEARASMIDMDPPVHTRLRRLVSSAFTPRHVLEYQRMIRDRVRQCLDDITATGGGDWIATVAKPIPISVICDLMGVPEADHDYMIELSDYLVAGTSNEPLESDAYGNTTELRLLPFNSPAAHGINEYARELGEKRRRQPADDLITKLINAEVDGERLSDNEFTNFFRLMIFAGNETTRSAIGHLALLCHRFGEEFARLTDDRSLIESGAEEVIRYSSPILYFRRTVTCDAELSGTPLKEGDKVVMWYAAANFDETVFDDPHRFDISRPVPPANVAFGGGGAHFCLGAPLARLELAILLDEIAARNLTIEVVGEPEFVRSNFVNGIEHVEVRIQ